MSGPRPLVLASASPRRAEILRTLGIPHEVLPAGVDESERPGETPEAHVERLALGKAAAVAPRRREAWILASDTVVAVEDRALGKPRDAGDAVRMLLELQGRSHRVLTSVALRAPTAPHRKREGEDPPEPGGRVWSGVEATEVGFRPFGREWAEGYAASGEPMDKAGAYGIQGLGSVLVERVDGDYTAVVGLPVSLLVRLFEEVGRPYRFPEG